MESLETSAEPIVEVKRKTESVGEIRQRIQAEFAKLGVPKCPDRIVERFIVLEQNSEFNSGSRMIREGVRKLLLAIDKKGISISTEKQRKTILAAFIGDIGKSSSSDNSDCQLAVVKLFSIANIQNGNQTVGETLQASFPNEIDDMTSGLSAIGVIPSMTMRAFWDKHAFWTKDILDKFAGDFSESTRIIAASHHIDRGIDPYKIETTETKDKIPDELRNCIYVFMIVDKYQAKIYRGGATHEEAIQYLKNDLRKYNGDSVINSLIDSVDELGGAGKLFPKNMRL